MGIPLVGYGDVTKDVGEGAFEAQGVRLFQTPGSIFPNVQFGYSKVMGCLKS